MDEEQKKRIAVFRFGAIANLVGGIVLDRGERERLIQEKCDHQWQIPCSERSRLSRTTLQRWIRQYDGQLESLYPRDRADIGQSRTLDEEVAQALIRTRQTFPRAPVRKLLEHLEREGWGKPAPSTAYRFLRERGLLKAQQTLPEDRRKFEAEGPNDLWQSDVLHGPLVETGNKKRKSYLIAFIDDYSRLVPYGAFYPGESLNFFLQALEQALAKRGLPRKLYVDNGSAFRSHHLEQITASLGIALIHARPYKPQGKGKIERWFKTVRGDFLSGFRGGTLDDLNQAFEHWLRDLYHHRQHSATGQPPFQRFASRLECLRLAPRNLRDFFRQTARRRVAKDRTISLNGKLFEAPVGLIGQQVTLRYHEAELERVEVFSGQQSYGLLLPVNLQVNSRVKRDKDSRLVLEASAEASYQGGALLGKDQPMTAVYRTFFGLSREPFGSDLRLKEILKTPALSAVQDRFEYTVRLGGFALVTGDIGSGKSTALRYVSAALHPSEYKIIPITATPGSILDLYRLLLAELHIEKSSTSRAVLTRLIQQEIRTLYEGKKIKPVLIIDEASLLRLEVLAELHLLTQFDQDSKPYLPVILAGQSPLVDQLVFRTSRPLASRIIARSHLQGVDRQQMADYLAHHLALAGLKTNPLEEAAITAIQQGSGGIFRKANHLARGALVAAAAQQSQIVTADHVRLAATEIF